MIGVGVHIYVYVYVCGPKQLNRTLAIDSPFQTFAVELLVERLALHCFLQKRFPRRVNQGFCAPYSICLDG